MDSDCQHQVDKETLEDPFVRGLLEGLDPDVLCNLVPNELVTKTQKEEIMAATPEESEAFISAMIISKLPNKVEVFLKELHSKNTRLNQKLGDKYRKIIKHHKKQCQTCKTMEPRQATVAEAEASQKEKEEPKTMERRKLTPSEIKKALHNGISPQNLAMYISSPEIIDYAQNLDQILINLAANLVISNNEKSKIKDTKSDKGIPSAFDDLIDCMYKKDKSKVDCFLEELKQDRRNKKICDILDERISDIQEVEAAMSQTHTEIHEDKKEEKISSIKDSSRANLQSHAKGPNITILLLGKTGVGKSKLGNNILEEKVFEVSGGTQSRTTKATPVKRKVRGRQIEVVDTPGSMDTQHPAKAIEEIASAVALHPEGYDALLLSVCYGVRFTAEEVQSSKLFRLLFSEAQKHTILVVTRGDTYRKDCEENVKPKNPDFGNELEETLLTYDDSTFGPLFRWCKKKWILIDNFEKGPMKIRQMNELVGIVDEIAKSTRGRKFYDSLFKETLDEKLKLQERGTETAETINLLLTAFAQAKIEQKFNCFPGTASVILFPGIKTSITDICSGNQVLCLNWEGKLAYNEVYMIGHRESEGFMNAITITTKSHKLTASEGHYIVVSSSATEDPLNSTKLMRDVSIGDHVLSLDPNTFNVTEEEVLEITRHIARGKYNPITFSGTIVVDGVVATCYEEHVRPRYAHLALGIIRMLYKISPAVLNVANYWTYRGIPYWAYGSLKAITYFKN